MATLKEKVKNLSDGINQMTDKDNIQVTKKFFESVLEDYKRLAELEDKLEQHTIVELPCKRGDTVYFIQSAFSLVAFPIDSKVVSIRGINCDGEVMYSAITNYNKLDRNFTSADIGKTVFLTLEEAEVKLKEMKSEHE